VERTKPGHQGSDLAALVDDELKRCLDHAAEGLHWVGPDGTILWANQTELDMLGYSAEEYIGHNIREFHVDPPVIADILARLGRGETLLGYDARIRRRDGAIRHVQINSNVRWDGDRFLHTRCFTRDVTDRRTAHAQNAFLLDLDDTLRPLTSAADIAYTAAAALGRHLQVARCAYATVADDEDTCHVTGNYTDGVASIVGRSTLGEFGDECRRVLRQGEAYVVTDVGSDQRIEDGARGSYVASGIAAAIWVPILKQGRLVAAVTVHSVTVRTWDAGEVALVQRVASRCWESLERARVTADLRESEQQFRDLANSIANLAWMARPDGWIYWYNDQWYSYTGTTPEQMEGWGWQRVHDPACLPDVMAQWQRSIDTGQPFEMVFPLRSATGEFRRFLTCAIPRAVWSAGSERIRTLKRNDAPPRPATGCASAKRLPGGMRRRPAAPRTSSWRCSDMSSATRWRPS
jgi:PAS domain S-box-containing protein